MTPNPQRSLKTRLIPFLILAGLLVYCFLFQGSRGLFEKDEGRYALVGLNMLKSGDYLHPRLHPEVQHYTKPPMIYAAIAASIRLFGQNEFAARFPSAASFLGCILFAYLLGTVFVPGRPWSVALIYAMFFFVVTASNMVTTDGLLTFFEVGAVTFFTLVYWASEENKRTRNILLMWLFFALAFATKGPPALLPLLSILIFTRLNKTNNTSFKFRGGLGLGIILAIGGSWFLFMMWENWALAKYFIQHEVFNRVFTGEHGRNSQWYAALYVYIPVLCLGTLPWSLPALKGFWRALKDWRSKYSHENAQEKFLLWWVTLPLTVFLFSGSRLPLYVLPLFAPMAVFAGRQLQRSNFSFVKNRVLIVLWCLAMLCVRFIGGQVQMVQDARWFAAEFNKAFPQPVNEVVFVEKRPIYGLGFYRNVAIERNNVVDGQLAEEMQDSNESRLWIVKPNMANLFPAWAAETGHPVQTLGTLKWDYDYTIFMEDSARIP